MKTAFRHTLVIAALVAVSAANAQSFDTLAGSSFAEHFLVKPTKDNAFVISISGLGTQFSDLSFAIGSGPTVIGSLKEGSWVAAFNDGRNPRFTLMKNENYSLRITGNTKSSTPGGFGQVSITTVNGSVTAIPEPETFAMLLAGLGLMGSIARQRSKAHV